MTQFSSETQQALKAHGWHEDRQIDTAEYERILRAAGYDDYQAVCAFLQRYGDLALQVTLRGQETYLDTSLSRIMEIMEPLPVSLFSQVMGRTLYFIGWCRYDFDILLMDSSGHVYRTEGEAAVYGVDLFLIAASGEEAIEKLFREENRDAAIRGKWIANGQWAAHCDGTLHVVSRVNPNCS